MKIIAVYQPHQNIRQHEETIQKGYNTCFENADVVYWLPTYLSRENDLKVLTPLEILQKAGLDKNEIFEIANLDQKLAEKLREHCQNNDLVVFMGAGNIDAWAKQNLDFISKIVTIG